MIVEPLTDAPDAIFASGRRVLAGTVTGDMGITPHDLHIASVSPFKDGFIVHFDEIADRNVAETWRDRYLLLPGDELQPPADDEIYLHDLVGMRVELESGEAVGPVVAVYELPQGLTLDVQRAKGTVLVPYDRIVTSVDAERRVIRIRPPEGLL